MEPGRFDALTRTFATRLSRRVALQATGLGLAAGLRGVPAIRSAAQEATPVASPTDDCSAGSEADNEALVLRWYDEVLNGRDLDVLDEIVAADADHVVSVFPDSRSRDETRQVLGGTLDAYPDFAVTVDQIFSVDDMVVTRWTASGTQSGDLQGHPESGEPTTFTGINIFEIACGQIIGSRSEFDTLTQFGEDPVNTDPIPATPEVASTPPADCDGSSADDSADVALQWYEIWNTQDLARFDEVVVPGTIHHWAFGNDTVGVDELRERLQTFLTGFPNLNVTIHDALVSGDMVVQQWTITGTQDGPFFGLEPSGVDVSWSGINIYRVQCGLVVESWSESNGLELREQLTGSSSATPAA